MTDALVDEVEASLRALAAELTDPRPGECLLCYVYRMLDHGCVGLRWAKHYRDLRAPRATGLEERLGRMGGYCDCEIFMNGFELRPEHLTPEVEREEEDGVVVLTDPEYPDPMPQCRQVRAGSTRPCTLWMGLSRRW